MPRCQTMRYLSQCDIVPPNYADHNINITLSCCRISNYNFITAWQPCDLLIHSTRTNTDRKKMNKLIPWRIKFKLHTIEGFLKSNSIIQLEPQLHIRMHDNYAVIFVASDIIAQRNACRINSSNLIEHFTAQLLIGRKCSLCDRRQMCLCSASSDIFHFCFFFSASTVIVASNNGLLKWPIRSF